LYDPLRFDGGANDLTGLPIIVREAPVHKRGLIFEQKRTKKTKIVNQRLRGAGARTQSHL
jgi:hypothetical protein